MWDKDLGSCWNSWLFQDFGTCSRILALLNLSLVDLQKIQNTKTLCLWGGLTKHLSSLAPQLPELSRPRVVPYASWKNGTHVVGTYPRLQDRSRTRTCIFSLLQSPFPSFPQVNGTRPCQISSFFFFLKGFNSQEEYYFCWRDKKTPRK